MFVDLEAIANQIFLFWKFQEVVRPGGPRYLSLNAAEAQRKHTKASSMSQGLIQQNEVQRVYEIIFQEVVNVCALRVEGEKYLTRAVKYPFYVMATLESLKLAPCIATVNIHI